MRGIAGALLVVAALAVTGCGGPPPIDAEGLPWPEEAAAIGYLDGDIVAHADDAPQPIASLTKVVSALVVLDEHPLAPGDAGAEITVTDADVRAVTEVRAADGIALPAQSGTVITQRDLLAGSLVASASNYAEMLAVWAFGSEDAYLDAAVAWLDAHGLDATTVTDASGLGGGSTATAADMVRLGRLALAEPVVAELVGAVETTAGGTAIRSTNDLLGLGFTGIKTGTDTRSHLIFSRPVGDRVVVGAVLGTRGSGWARQAAMDLTEALVR